MRIGIDARFYGSVGKGLGRYTEKLIENLELFDQENEYVIFLMRENFDEYTPRNTHFHKVLAEYPWYSIAEQILFPIALLRFRLDVVHFPHFNVPIFYPNILCKSIFKNTTICKSKIFIKFWTVSMSKNEIVF